MLDQSAVAIHNPLRLGQHKARDRDDGHDEDCLDETVHGSSYLRFFGCLQPGPILGGTLDWNQEV
jgi:hypothetical protein